MHTKWQYCSICNWYVTFLTISYVSMLVLNDVFWLLYIDNQYVIGLNVVF